MRIFSTLVFCLTLSTLLPSSILAEPVVEPASGEKELKLVRITPEGEDVPPGRQVVFTFNRPVVPIGKMGRSKDEIPIVFAPELNCSWRWLNTSSLACNLDEKDELKRATKYQIVVKPDLRAEDGAGMAQAQEHSFITERPEMRYSWFKTWKSPSFPLIRLTFNQSVTKDSVARHLYLSKVDDQTTNANRMPLVVEPDPDDREAPMILAFPGEKAFVVANPVKQKSDEDLRHKDGLEARRVWIVSPEEELALDSSYSLKIEPGLVSALGPETGIGDRVLVQFDTFPEFAFLGVKCRSNRELEVLVAPGQTQGPNELCNPLDSISLSFSVPVFSSQVKKHCEFTPDLAGGRADFDPWGPLDREYSRLGTPHRRGASYEVFLPGGLKAAEKYLVSVRGREIGSLESTVHGVESVFGAQEPLAETDLEDEFGRKLLKPVSITFATDHRLPNYEIVHHDAMIEKSITSEVPLYVNNLESVTLNYRRVTAAGVSEKQTFRQQIPQVQDVQFAVPFKVREMLEGNSGAVYGRLTTEPAVGKPYYLANRLFAQVTPFQVHVKLGHFSSVAWVSDLATGAAVVGAKLTIYKDALATISPPKSTLATVVTDEQGIAKFPGTEVIDPSLELSPQWESGEDPDARPRLFLRVDKGKDIALMPLSDDFLLNTWRVSGYSHGHDNRGKYGHIQTWGTTAQGIYRAGDTIQYKIFVRNQNDQTFVPAPRQGYALEIVDPTDKVVEARKDIELTEFGSFSGEFAISKHAAVGWYQFRLSSNFAKLPFDSEGEAADTAQREKLTWYPLRVLVSDFTPSPFRVSNELNGDLFKPQSEIEVSSAAKLHSGGAYTDASVRITALLEAQVFSSKHSVAKGFYFGAMDTEQQSQQIYQKIEALDAQGELRHKFAVPKQNILYGKLLLESAVQDDRGKYIAALSRADYVGAERFVGLRSPKWLYREKEPAEIEYLVVDARGNPVAGTGVEVKVERLVTNAARVKGAGNAYITNFTSDWKQESTCNGISQEQPLICQFTPSEAGSYRLVGRVEDVNSVVHSTEFNIWVTGQGYVLWEEESDALLKIVPEKSEYRVGETARYLVKNPFPGAKALVTVERYGVIDHFVQTLEGSTPVIEFPIKPDYLPGFYLSILVFSPRVEKPSEDALGQGQVDLGKPSFRIGYLEVPVKDQHKELIVTVKPERELYKPREKVRVQVHAEPKVAASHRERIELAAIVLDEAVFDLIAGGRNYFDPYWGFYQLSGLDLRNYSLLTSLVGRQKFEKKGANPGGDGGANLALRNIFKFVSYWNPSLLADAQGDATFEFEVPDNLTGWRVLLLAASPADRFGLGEGSFKVNRPTEIRPVMPNQVTEGDSFQAGFSVMNRTDKVRTVKVAVTATGDIDTKATADTHSEVVTLEPYKRMSVFMPIKSSAVSTARAVEKGEMRFVVRAGDELDFDSIEHLMPINKQRSLETAANYGTSTEETVKESLFFPAQMHSDIGEVSVVVSPSVIASVEGAFRYIKKYPYSCWEQILTKGVMAAAYLNLKSYLPESFTWKESNDLPTETLSRATNFQAPNGGMCYFIPADAYVDPYLSAYTALAFNWLRRSGYKVPEQVEVRLQGYLLDLLRRDVVPDFYHEGMSSTVRAVALAALAENGKITFSDLERYRRHLTQMSLFGKTHFLLAAMRVKGGEVYLAEVSKLILSFANQTAGKFVFSEELDDSYLRLLSSPLRENCAILDAFTALAKTPEGKDTVGDVPFKLVRMITQTRQNREHWENTQENVFCLNALTEYSRVYENVKPKMTVQASMDSQVFGKTKFNDLRDTAVTFTREINKDDPGRSAEVEINRSGEGRLYYATRLSYAPLGGALQAMNAGMEVRREYSVERDNQWVLLQSPFEVQRGELVRVDLFLTLPAARNFVVVEDPVPGGLEPVNRDLATASEVDARKGDFTPAGGSIWFKFSDWIGYNVSRWSFYHQELRFDSVRFYSDYLPAGNYHLSYTAQVIAAGKFAVMPLKAEEMYDPDVFGKGVGEQLSVR